MASSDRGSTCKCSREFAVHVPYLLGGLREGRVVHVRSVQPWALPCALPPRMHRYLIEFIILIDFDVV